MVTAQSRASSQSYMKEQEQGIMDGLRSVIERDNHSAVDESQLRRGMRPFYVQKPNFSEDYPEAAFRVGADDLTLRAEEVKTLIACINVDHIEETRWGPPLVAADWHGFCQAMYKGIE